MYRVSGTSSVRAVSHTYEQKSTCLTLLIIVGEFPESVRHVHVAREKLNTSSVMHQYCVNTLPGKGAPSLVPIAHVLPRGALPTPGRAGRQSLRLHVPSPHASGPAEVMTEIDTHTFTFTLTQFTHAHTHTPW